MLLLAILLSWGISVTDTLVEVDEGVLCLHKEELQPRQTAPGVVWGWNDAEKREPLYLGYCVEGVTSQNRELCIEAIKRWGGQTHGIRIHLSRRLADEEKTIVFVEEPFSEPLLALATSEHPWTGGPSSRIRINSRANWSRYSLLHVLVHEVGHALGFAHVRDEDSVMRSYYTGQERLGWSDIMRASTLYLTRPWPGAAGKR